MLLLNVNFLSRDFLYLFKYGLVSGVILALKICYSLKFLKFRPFTPFHFYKHYKHTSCRHYLMFVEFQGKSIFEQKRLFAKYSTKWEERQMHRHKESVGIYHVRTQTKPPSFSGIYSIQKRAKRRVLKSRRLWNDMLIIHNPLKNHINNFSNLYINAPFSIYKF